MPKPTAPRREAADNPPKRSEGKPQSLRARSEQDKPTPIDPAELTAVAGATMKSARFPFLATIDGNQPRLRPVSPVRTDGFTVYVANLRSYSKTAEIAANANVELAYLDEEHNQVRITGTARILEDDALLAEIWDSNPLLRQYLGTRENPELIVYRIRPNRIRYMREWALNYHEVPLPEED